MSLATACAQISAAAGGCTPLTDDQQQSLMSHARTDFRYGTNRITEITYVDSATVELPADLQKYGAVRLLVARIGAFPESAEGSDIPGIRTSALFAAGDDERVVAALDDLAETFFDYPASEESGWDAYAKRVLDSDAVTTALGCVS